MAHMIQPPTTPNPLIDPFRTTTDAGFYAKLRGLMSGRISTAPVGARADGRDHQASKPSRPRRNIYERAIINRHRNTDAMSFQAIAEAWMLWWLMQNKMVSPMASTEPQQHAARRVS